MNDALGNTLEKYYAVELDRREQSEMRVPLSGVNPPIRSNL